MDKNLIQGSMGMLVLRLLEEKDMYGYEMIDTLRSRSNQVFELKAGTLYPLLHTLEDKGYVSSYEEEVPSGKNRKYYHLTREGKRHVAQKKAEWQQYQSAVASVLAAPGNSICQAQIPASHGADAGTERTIALISMDPTRE